MLHAPPSVCSVCVCVCTYALCTELCTLHMPCTCAVGMLCINICLYIIHAVMFVCILCGSRKCKVCCTNDG